MYRYGPYSPSRMDSAACPARFHAEYIADTRVRGESIVSKRGNVVHEVFEDITKGIMRGKYLTWEQVEKLLADRIAGYALTDMGEIDFCIRACKTYMGNLPAGYDKIIGTEEKIAIKRGHDGWEEGTWEDCDFRGKIDILKIDGNRASFIDHKTQPFVETADTFQMGFYAWLISVIYPQVDTVESVLHFASPDINHYSKPFMWDKELLENIESQSKIMAMTVENLTSYEAIPNYFCQYCPILLECGVAEKFYGKRSAYGKLKNAPVRSGQEAIDLASTLTVVDEGRKVLNKRLQAFTKDIGPVMIRGKEYGYNTTESYEPRDESAMFVIFDIIKATGMSPMKFFKLDATAIKGIWRFLNETDIKKIKEQLRLVKKSRFAGRKL